MRKLVMGMEERDSLAAALKELSYFSNASIEDLGRVVAATHLYAIEKGRKTVFKKGHIGDALYIIHKGAVEIIRPHFPSPRRPIARLGPGDAFGEMALLNHPYRVASAITDGYTELFVLLSPDFAEIFRANPEPLKILRRHTVRRGRVAT